MLLFAWEYHNWVFLIFPGIWSGSKKAGRSLWRMYYECFWSTYQDWWLYDALYHRYPDFIWILPRASVYAAAICNTGIKHRNPYDCTVFLSGRLQDHLFSFFNYIWRMVLCDADSFHDIWNPHTHASIYSRKTGHRCGNQSPYIRLRLLLLYVLVWH